MESLVILSNTMIQLKGNNPKKMCTDTFLCDKIDTLIASVNNIPTALISAFLLLGGAYFILKLVYITLQSGFQW